MRYSYIFTYYITECDLDFYDVVFAYFSERSSCICSDISKASLVSNEKEKKREEEEKPLKRSPNCILALNLTTQNTPTFHWTEVVSGR